MKIESIKAREILDSRGNPTVETTIRLEDGSYGIASVPSGASTGTQEAVELRDGNPLRYYGKGVKIAVEHVNREIAENLVGDEVYTQMMLDRKMCTLDATKNKAHLGANAILSVSFAAAKAAAASLGIPLYRYLGGIYGNSLPMPMMNVINGGKHADSNLNLQEFMIMPIGAASFAEKMQWSCEVYHVLKRQLKEKGLATSVGDEGGFAPQLNSEEEALECMVNAVRGAGFVEERDFVFALDVAANEMYLAAAGQGRDGEYLFWKSGEYKTAKEMIKFLQKITEKYPVVSIEDGLAEEDWENWSKMQELFQKKVQLVGDDLFVTNPERIRRGLEGRAASAVLIKPNQIGTLTETMEAIRVAQRGGWNIILSHRSGETEDTAIADIAVAVNAGQIKIGAPTRGERIVKYNRLLRIEQEW